MHEAHHDQELPQVADLGAIPIGDVIAVTRATVSDLEYWATQGAVRHLNAGERGRGKPRRYSFENIIDIGRLVEIRGIISVPQAGTIPALVGPGMWNEGRRIRSIISHRDIGSLEPARNDSERARFMRELPSPQQRDLLLEVVDHTIYLRHLHDDPKLESASAVRLAKIAPDGFLIVPQQRQEELGDRAQQLRLRFDPFQKAHLDARTLAEYEFRRCVCLAFVNISLAGRVTERGFYKRLHGE